MLIASVRTESVRRATVQEEIHEASHPCLPPFAIGLSGFGLMSQAENVGRPSDEDAIRKIVVVMTEAFNRHDAKAATQMYAPDARFVTVRGEVMDGQPAIEKGLASILGTRAKNASQRTLDVAVKFIRPDIALVHVTNELSGLVAADGQRCPHTGNSACGCSPKIQCLARGGVPKHLGQALQRSLNCRELGEATNIHCHSPRQPAAGTKIRMRRLGTRRNDEIVRRYRRPCPGHAKARVTGWRGPR